MIEKEAYTWQDIVDALNNDGVAVSQPMVIKLMKDIDCNDEIPEGVETTLSLRSSGSGAQCTIDGSYTVNDVVYNRVIRNLRTHIITPVLIFQAKYAGFHFKNVDFVNLILDQPLLKVTSTNGAGNVCEFNHCRFVGRRTYNLWDNIYKSSSSSTKMTGAGVKLYSCFFNIPYIKSPFVVADIPLERNDDSTPKYNSYAYFCRFVESHNADTGITSCNNLNLSGCRIQGELVSSSPITITSQYEYDSVIQNVVDLNLKTTAEQGTTVVVNAPKGVWKDAIYSTDSAILTPYQYTNTNPLAIPESPADMIDVLELYSDGFDVQQPNPNSVGGNNG